MKAPQSEPLTYPTWTCEVYDFGLQCVRNPEYSTLGATIVTVGVGVLVAVGLFRFFRRRGIL